MRNIERLKLPGYKLWNMEKEKNRNEVAMHVDNLLKENIVNVKRVGDRIIFIKLVVININSAP